MKKLSLKTVNSDERGTFSTIFDQQDFRELNYVTSKQGVRGNHYHKVNREIIFMLSGKCEVTVKNINTQQAETFTLGPHQGVFIEPYELHTFTIMEESTWLSAVSNPFDPEAPDMFRED